MMLVCIDRPYFGTAHDVREYLAKIDVGDPDMDWPVDEVKKLLA